MWKYSEKKKKNVGKSRQVATQRLRKKEEGFGCLVGGGQREKKGLHWSLSDIATIGISQTMAAAADMPMHIW